MALALALTWTRSLARSPALSAPWPGAHRPRSWLGLGLGLELTLTLTLTLPLTLTLTLGQGGCQAIEDAYELTRALQGVTVRGAAPGEPEEVHRALLYPLP